MLYALRVSLPDRPGSLGSLASAISHIPASIVSLNVLERDESYATDEICVSCEDGVPAEHVRRVAESIPGIVVEMVRRVDAIPDPLAALQLSVRLAQDARLDTLVDGICEALSASWAMALESANGVMVLAATSGAPTPAQQTPFLPLEGARRLEVAAWMPQRWKISRWELAAVPLDAPNRCMIVGRGSGMRFRGTELRQLELLALMTVPLILKV